MLVLIIAVLVLAFFWKILLKVIIAALIIGFVILCVTSAFGIAHGLHALLP
jgi:hypothetical protein